MTRLSRLLAALVLCLATPALAGSDFTYQGQLSSGGAAASGSYDFQFTLYDSATLGSVVGSTVSASAVTVSGGVFTADLDFGALAFSGGDRYLEVAVRPAGSGSYTTLSPRQKVTAAPLALMALGNVKLSGDTMTGPLALPSDGLTVGSNQLVVTNSGQVGLGTGTPNANLAIRGTGGGTIFTIDNGDTYYYGFYVGNGDLGLFRGESNGSLSVMNYSSNNNLISFYPAIYMESAVMVGASTLTSNITLAPFTTPEIVLVNSTFQAVTVTLPSASSAQGTIYTIKHSAGSNAVTLAAPSGETIDGASAVTLAAAYAFRTVYSNGAAWFVIGQ